MEMEEAMEEEKEEEEEVTAKLRKWIKRLTVNVSWKSQLTAH